MTVKLDGGTLLLLGGVAVLALTGAGVAAAAGVRRAGEARESASNWLTDAMAWATGLEAHQNRIVTDPTYAAIEASIARQERR